jgi:DinB family protein
MNTEQIMVKMTFDRWHALMKQFDDALASLTDKQLEQEISPGRNRGVYLLGHLTAVHDNMIPLLDLGEKMYPELYEPFINTPDKSVDIPAAAELREKWHNLNRMLTQQFNSMQPADWFQRHTAVTAEDFMKEPYRNKLNIIVTRASHLAYHLGQFILIK